MITGNQALWRLTDDQGPRKSLHRGARRALVGLLALGVTTLGGCASTSGIELPEPLRPPLQEAPSPAARPERVDKEPSGPRFTPTPTLPPPQTSSARPATLPLSPKDRRQVTVNIEGLAVPAFINEVYGNLLGLSFQMDATVQAKKDVANLRITQPQSAAQVRKLVDQMLQDYGVRVESRGEILRFSAGQGATRAGDSPVFVFGPRLPAGLSSDTAVAQFLTLEVVRNTQVAGWLRQAYQGQRIEISEDPERNAIVLWGPAAVVRQAAETARLLDQPLLRGRYSLSIEPMSWTAGQLAKRLEEVLQAEGYSVVQRGVPGGSVLLLPMEEVNTILVFAADEQLLVHIRRWVEKLDQPRQDPDQGGLFYYLAQNVPAQGLVKTLSPLLTSLVGGGLSQTGTVVPQTPVSIAPALAAGVPAATVASGGIKNSGFATNLVVDEARNALIFSGSGEQWARLRPVLEVMDQPAKLALIEVTVAEITLSDTQDTGVEWVFNNVNIGNWQGTLTNALDVGTDGFSYLLTKPDDSKILLNALATNTRVSILSNPRVMVRNGQEATIDVGTEVPILTSQSTTEGTGTGGNPAILQQIQYRKTGVLLKVKPTIYAGRRVDLDVAQEVSEAQLNTTSSISSPQILNRKINTSLSLKDGGSVLLGGLVSNNRSQGNRGIPILKDVPLLGALFRADSLSQNRTELVVLITPYILSDEREAEAITQAFRQRLSFGAPDGDGSSAPTP